MAEDSTGQVHIKNFDKMELIDGLNAKAFLLDIRVADVMLGSAKRALDRAKRSRAAFDIKSKEIDEVQAEIRIISMGRACAKSGLELIESRYEDKE